MFRRAESADGDACDIPTLDVVANVKETHPDSKIARLVDFISLFRKGISIQTP